MLIETLKLEIGVDPLNRNYSGMTDEELLVDLNSEYRSVERGAVPSHEVLENTEPTEFSALSTAEKQRYQIFISAGEVNLSGPNTKASFAAMFGPGTTTRSSLIAISKTNVSRSEELGLRNVTVGDIAFARSL